MGKWLLKLREYIREFLQKWLGKIIGWSLFMSIEIFSGFKFYEAVKKSLRIISKPKLDLSDFVFILIDTIPPLLAIIFGILIARKFLLGIQSKPKSQGDLYR